MHVLALLEVPRLSESVAHETFTTALSGRFRGCRGKKGIIPQFTKFESVGYNIL